MQPGEVPENPKSGRKLTRMLGTLWLEGSFLNEDFVAAMDSGKRYSPAILSSSPPGLTDEEIDLAFQQSGTAAEEPPSLGPGTQVVPVQPPHLISQPYSKSPAQTPPVTLTGVEDSGQRAVLPISQTPQAERLGRADSSWVFPEERGTPRSSPRKTFKYVTKV